MSYNKIIIIGNLGRDPEQRPAGQSTATTFTVATNESYRDSKGEQVEHTTWFNVTAWNKQGDTLMKYVKKGNQIYLEGRLRQREYLKQDGTPGTSLDVTVENFQLLGSREGGQQGSGEANADHNQQGSGGSTRQYETTTINRTAPPSEDNPADDLPF